MSLTSVIRNSLFIIIYGVALSGCSLATKATGESPSKREVMRALTKVCGEEVAKQHFGEWLQEYRIESESDLDSEVCTEILEQITKENVSPEMMKQKISSTRQRLLGEVDHAHLLVAFRDVMRNRKSFKNDPGWKHSKAPKNQDDVSFISGADSCLPPVIFDLRAETLVCENEMMTAIFRPGFRNMGFIAYTEGINVTPNGAHEKYQKLIDGLWFFEPEPMVR